MPLLHELLQVRVRHSAPEIPASVGTDQTETIQTRQAADVYGNISAASAQDAELYKSASRSHGLYLSSSVLEVCTSLGIATLHAYPSWATRQQRSTGRTQNGTCRLVGQLWQMVTFQKPGKVGCASDAFVFGCEIEAAGIKRMRSRREAAQHGGSN